MTASRVTRQLQVHWRFAAFLSVLGALGASTVVWPQLADTTGGLAVLVGHMGVATIALAKTRGKTGRDRLVWRLFGVAFTLSATGVLLLVLADAFAIPVPAFGPIDLFFLLAYAGVLGAAVALPDAFRGQRDVVKTVVDGVVGAVSVGTLIWIFVVGDVVEYFAHGTAWDKWAGGAYPLLDVLTIIVFVTLLSRRSQYRMDPRLAFLALGAACQVAGDLMFLNSGVGSTFAAAEPHYPAFITSSVMFATGAYLADVTPRPREYAERALHYFGSVAPYAVAVGLATVTLVSLPQAGFDKTAQLLTGATLVVGVLVLARQSLSIRDNRHHVDQKRTDLVASISHELLTPLTAVVGFLDLINDPQVTLASDESAEMLGIAHREASRMSRIITDLTLLTRCSPADMAFSAVVTPVVELVDETLRTLGLSDVAITTRVEDDLAAFIDRGRVQQVIINFVENAARYGDGVVEVVAHNDDGDLVIEVHDNGNGVPKHDHNIMWNQFERGAHRFNAAIPGSGIGLAVVAAIAEAHGGEASYRESERLGGACFLVVLPLRAMEVTPAVVQADPVLYLTGI